MIVLKKITKIIGYILAAVLGLLLITLVFIHSFLNSPKLFNQSLSWAAPYSGLYANTQDIDFWLWPVKLKLTNFRVFTDQNKTEVAISIDKIDFAGHYTIFDEPQAIVSKLIIDNLDINLKQSAAGLFNWQLLNKLQNPENSTSRSSTSQNTAASVQADDTYPLLAQKWPHPEFKLLINDLQINNANFSINLAPNAILANISNFNIQTKNWNSHAPSTINIEGDFKLQQGLNTEPAKISEPLLSVDSHYAVELKSYFNEQENLIELNTSLNSNLKIKNSKNTLTPLDIVIDNYKVNTQILAELDKKILRWPDINFSWQDNSLQLKGLLNANKPQQLVVSAISIKAKDLGQVSGLLGHNLQKKVPATINANFTFDQENTGFYIDGLSIDIAGSKYQVDAFLTNLKPDKKPLFKLQVTGQDPNPQQKLNIFSITNVNINKPLSIDIQAGGSWEKFAADIQQIAIGQTKISLSTKNEAGNQKFKSQIKFNLSSESINELLLLAKAPVLQKDQSINLDLTTNFEFINDQFNIYDFSLVAGTFNIQAQGSAYLGAKPNITLTAKAIYNSQPLGQVKISGDLKKLSWQAKYNNPLQNSALDFSAVGMASDINTKQLRYQAELQLKSTAISTTLANLPLSIQALPFKLPNSLDAELQVMGGKEFLKLNPSKIVIDNKSTIEMEANVDNFQSPKIRAQLLIADINLEEYQKSQPDQPISGQLSPNTKKPTSDQTEAEPATPIDIDQWLQKQILSAETIVAINKIDAQAKITLRNISYKQWLLQQATTDFSIGSKLQQLQIKALLQDNWQQYLLALNQSFSLDLQNKLDWSLELSNLDLLTDISTANTNDNVSKALDNKQILLVASWHSLGKNVADQIKTTVFNLDLDIDRLQPPNSDLILTAKTALSIQKGKFNLQLPKLHLLQDNSQLTLQNLQLSSDISRNLHKKFNIDKFSLETLNLVITKAAADKTEDNNKLALNSSTIPNADDIKKILQKIYLPSFELQKIPDFQANVLELNEGININIKSVPQNTIQTITVKPFRISNLNLDAPITSEINLTASQLPLEPNTVKPTNQETENTTPNNDSWQLQITNVTKLEVDRQQNQLDLDNQLYLDWENIAPTDSNYPAKLSFRVNSLANWQTSPAKLTSQITIEDNDWLYLKLQTLATSPNQQMDAKGSLKVTVADANNFIKLLSHKTTKTAVAINIDSDFSWQADNLQIKGQVITNDQSPITWEAALAAKETVQANLNIFAETLSPAIDNILGAYNIDNIQVEGLSPLSINLFAEHNLNSTANLAVNIGEMELSLAGLLDYPQDKYDLKINANKINLDKLLIVKDDPNKKNQDTTVDSSTDNTAEEEKDDPSNSNAAIKKIYSYINDQQLYPYLKIPAYQAAATLNIDDLTWHKQNIANIFTKVSIDKKRLQINKLAIQQKSGVENISIAAVLDASTPIIFAGNKLEIKKLDVGHLSLFLTGQPLAAGNIDINMHSDTMGHSSKELIKNLRSALNIRSPLIKVNNGLIDKYSCLATSALRSSYFTADTSKGSRLENINLSNKIKDGVLYLDSNWNLQTTSASVNSGRGYFDIVSGQIDMTTSANLFSSQEYESCATPMFTKQQSLRLTCQGNILNQDITEICKPNKDDVIITIATVTSSILNPLEWIRKIWKILAD